MTGFLLLCLAALGIAEFATIALLVAPYPQSTIRDWMIAALFIAPLLAGAMIWVVGVTYRITTDLRHGWRRITGKTRTEDVRRR